MAPALGVDASRVRADVEEVPPLIVRQLRGISRPGDMGLAGIGEFEFRALGLAIGAADEQHVWLLSVGDGRGGGLVDQSAGGEALEREGRVDRVRLVARDGVGEDMRRTWRCLEATRAPAAIDIEAGHRRLAENG